MVSSINSGADSMSSLQQLFQQSLANRAQRSGQAGDASGPGGTRPQGGPPPQGADMESQFASAAEELGLDASQISDLQAQIDEAVAAVEASGLEEDEAREQISAAVDSVLEENGIDAEEFKSALQSMADASTGGTYGPPPGGGMGMSGPGGQMSPEGAPPTGGGPSTDDRASAATTLGLDEETAASLAQEIEAALSEAQETEDGEVDTTTLDSIVESYGLDVEAFKSELDSLRDETMADQSTGGAGQSMGFGMPTGMGSGMSMLNQLRNMPAGSFLNVSV